jgi:hypothetical protein
MEIAAGLLMILFLYTAISKLLMLDAFRSVLSRSPLLGDISNLIAWFIPLTEIAIAILLFIPSSRKLAFLFSTVLLTIFSLYITYMLIFSRDLPCSCGGVLNGLGWKPHLVFNCCFIAIALAGWRLAKPHKDFIAINRLSRTPV